MILENQLFQVLYSPHISEKSAIISEKYHKITFQVSIKCSKYHIKLAVEKLFSVNVKKINIVFMKGKRKIKGKNHIIRNNWKKAYITLKKGQKLDVMNHV